MAPHVFCRRVLWLCCFCTYVTRQCLRLPARARACVDELLKSALLLNCVGAAVFGLTAIFGVALGTLCWRGHFHSWRLVFRVVRHSALLAQLYFHIVHDVCVGFARFDGRIVFVLVDLCCCVGVLPGPLLVWIPLS